MTQQTEASLIRIFNSVTDPFVIYDRDYRILQDSIDSHRENIRDTLKDERCTEHEAHAWAIFDAAIARLTA